MFSGFQSTIETSISPSSSLPLISFLSDLDHTSPLTDPNWGMSSSDSASSSSPKTLPRRTHRRRSPRPKSPKIRVRQESSAAEAAFLQACISGDLEEITSTLLDRSLDVTYDDFAAVRVAIKKGNARVLAELMNDPRIKIHGNRWFILSCGFNHIDVTIFLSNYVSFPVMSACKLVQAKEQLLLDAVERAAGADLPETLQKLFTWEYLQFGPTLAGRLSAYERAFRNLPNDGLPCASYWALRKLLMAEPGSKDYKYKVAMEAGFKAVASIIKKIKENPSTISDSNSNSWF